jgi:Leucine-rich repeat (LRR) protein
MQKIKEINLKKNKIGSSVSKLAGNPALLLTLETLNLSYNRIEDADLENVATVILQMKQGSGSGCYYLGFALSLVFK